MLHVPWGELEQAGICVSENGDRTRAMEEPIQGRASPAAILDAVTALLQRMPPGWSLVGATLIGSNRLEFTYEAEIEARLKGLSARARYARQDADRAAKDADEAEWRARATYNDLLAAADPERLQRLQPKIAGAPRTLS